MRTFVTASALSLALTGCGKSAPETDTDEPSTADTFLVADGNDTFEDAEDLTSAAINEFDVEETNSNFSILAEAQIAPEGDRDFYAITLDAGTTYEFRIFAYVLQQRVVLDSVIRLYDGQQNLIAENDDLLLRVNETDSGVVYTATESGTYYVEVLEFGDWWTEQGNSGAAAEGGFDYEYLLGAVVLPNNEGDPNDLVSDVEIDLTLDTDARDDTDGFDPTAAYYHPMFLAGFAEFVGNFSSETDVDWWPIYIPVAADDATDDGGYVFTWISLWDGNGANTSASFSLFDADGNLLAESASPESDGTSLWFADPGVMSKTDRDTMYYLKVEDTEGTTGTNAVYPGIVLNYLSTLASLEDEDDGNESLEDANTFDLEASTTTVGRYDGAMWGELPEGDSDVFRIAGADVGDFTNKFVSIFVSAADMGSQIDPKIELYDEEGTLVTELSIDDESDEESPDPNLRDLSWAGTDLFVKIVAESRTGTDATASQYIISMIISPTEIFGE